MADDSITNILNLLQGSNSSKTNANNAELSTMLLKFLLSGGLNNLLHPHTNASNETPSRTIDLANYQRLD